MQVRRPLRASFVVTVATGALVGCGSTVVQSPTPNDAAPDHLSPDVAEVSPPPINPPPPDVPVASCPPSAPASGGTCDPSLSRVCTYGDCFGRPTIEARCAGGAWLVMESTCNPPPPEVCPATPPMSGDPCTYVGPTCTYGTCPPSMVTLAQCMAGRWSLGVSTCNPPIDAGPPPDA